MAKRLSFNVAHEPVKLGLVAGVATSFLLPIIDPANPDMHVINQGLIAVFLSFGTNANVGPALPGNVVISAGQVITLTTKPDVLSDGEKHLVQGGDQARKAGFTMTVTGWATKTAMVLIYRGEASLVVVDEPLSGPIFDQKGRARMVAKKALVPAMVWSASVPQPQTDTFTAWPKGWPPA